MTNPEERGDPWIEALNCFTDFSDELIIKGKDWPYEFKWDYIGKNFESGIREANGDWVIVMALDFFFHERFKKILLPPSGLLTSVRQNRLIKSRAVMQCCLSLKAPRRKS